MSMLHEWILEWMSGLGVDEQIDGTDGRMEWMDGWIQNVHRPRWSNEWFIAWMYVYVREMDGCEGQIYGLTAGCETCGLI